MKRSTLILLKTLTWIACLWPMAVLLAARPIWDWWQNYKKSRRAAAQTAGD